MSFQNLDELKDKLRQIASDCVSKGPGYAGVVLYEARRDLGPQTLADEQMILKAWHRLFIDGEFDWGYDLDNPSAHPFFVRRLTRWPRLAERNSRCPQPIPTTNWYSNFAGHSSRLGPLVHNLQRLGRGGNAVTWLMLAGSGPLKGRPFDEGVYLDDHPFVVAEFLPQTLANTTQAQR